MTSITGRSIVADTCVNTRYTCVRHPEIKMATSHLDALTRRVYNAQSAWTSLPKTTALQSITGRASPLPLVRSSGLGQRLPRLNNGLVDGLESRTSRTHHGLHAQRPCRAEPCRARQQVRSGLFCPFARGLSGNMGSWDGHLWFRPEHLGQSMPTAVRGGGICTQNQEVEGDISIHH